MEKIGNFGGDSEINRLGMFILREIDDEIEKIGVEEIIHRQSYKNGHYNFIHFIQINLSIKNYL